MDPTAGRRLPPRGGDLEPLSEWPCKRITASLESNKPAAGDADEILAQIRQMHRKFSVSAPSGGPF